MKEQNHSFLITKFLLLVQVDAYLFLISASLRPSLGVSTVKAIALKPALSALRTSCAATFLSLQTWLTKREFHTTKITQENLKFSAYHEAHTIALKISISTDMSSH